MRNRSRLLVLVPVLYLIACAGAATFVAEGTLHPQRRLLLADAENQVRRLLGAEDIFQNVLIAAPDRALLRAWFIRPPHENGSAVLLLHGLGDNRLGVVGYANMLVRHGYDILIPDARSHGQSGGEIATYGVLERYDIQRWVEWLQARQHPACVFALGTSMGAAQLLQSLDVTPDFSAVIAESSFANFREIAYDRMGQQFGAGSWVGRSLLRPLMETALLYARFKYHIDLTMASPEEATSRTQVPVLLIHGEVDGNIPIRHSRLIRSRAPKTELWEVAGADHCGSISVAPAELEQRTLNWFATHQLRATKLAQSGQN